jgi:hypothetical protein
MLATCIHSDTTRRVLAALLVTVVAGWVTTAVAQQGRPPAPGNFNSRRPVPVAARSQFQPPAVARNIRQEQVPPVQPSERQPGPSAEMMDLQPPPETRSAQPLVQGPGAPPEVYYDDSSFGYDDGYYGGWATPIMPMLAGMSFSVRGEFLYWWTSPMNTPVLATSAPANTPVPQAGVLGEPTTNVLLGTELNDGVRPGARFTGNLWFDPWQNRGLEGSFMFLGTESNNFAINSNQLPVIARPFFNSQTGAQDSELVAYPNELTGDLAVDAETSFHMGDILYRWNVSRDEWRRFDLLLGYRFAYLKDQIQIRENLTSIGNTIVPLGTTISVTDSFASTNYFNGIELGIAGQRQTMWGDVDFWLKSALGNTRMRSTIAGSTATTANGVTTNTDEGFLALPTNIGTRDRDEFSTIVELGGKFNRDFGPWRASVGYSVLLWSAVGRGGDLIDNEVNTSQLPPGPLAGEPTPRFHERQRSFWAQGVTFGLERYF